MTISEIEVSLCVPVRECPFCDGEMEGGQEPSTADGPGDYYFRCRKCLAGDQGVAYVDDFLDDRDHPFDAPRNEVAHWVIPESEIGLLRDQYRTEALEAKAEQEETA